MIVEVHDNAEDVAKRAASIIADEARAAVAARGRFVIAISGGRTPWAMLRTLASENVPWEHVHVMQVDERVAPLGDKDRNLTHLQENLLAFAPLHPLHLHAMPVEARDLDAAARQYSLMLQDVAGTPAVLDFVQLGLGADGHTASLVPNDPVLYVIDADVAITGEYQSRSRMTLTYPIINRARRILWVVTGEDKARSLTQLCDHDPSIPAGRVAQDRALLVADRAASPTLQTR